MYIRTLHVLSVMNQLLQPTNVHRPLELVQAPSTQQSHIAAATAAAVLADCCCSSTASHQTTLLLMQDADL
jgi:hypothetical protein